MDTICKVILAFLVVINSSSIRAKEEDSVDFSVMPQICIVAKMGQNCSIKITATWSSKVALDVCLLHNKQKEHCWLNQTQGQFNMTLNVNKATVLALTNSDNEVVASANIIINAAAPSRYRRRLRAAWSFF